MADDPKAPRDPREDAETRTSWGRGETAPAGSGSPASGSGPIEPGPPLLAPGDQLGERYTIQRLIARGGMGEVYEAFDRELQERVALKTIRSELAASVALAERFRREIQLARRVTHPNVCRLFDLGSAEGPRGPVSFLTMELLDGESLADRLHRTGAIDATEAMPIVRQVAAGLDAAHRAGVIHRDFKSGNVLLVPEGDGVRAVVTDFGLARQAVADDAHSITMSGGGLVGSPAYMAPEQIEGAELTPATDLYALGIVMYEMRTGRLPFTGATPMSVALRRLKEPPPPPHSINAAIDPAWERAILKCLAREPAARYQGANEVLLELDAGALAHSATARAPQRARGTRVTAGIVALALLGALVAVALWRSRERPAAGATPAVTADTGAPGAAPSPALPGVRRPVVAVLGFKNSSGREDAAWLSTALGEMLATELAAGERVRTVPGEVVARATQGLGLVPADSLAADTLLRLRSQLGADYVVVGAYAALGEGSTRQVRFDVRLQDAVRGETVISVAETGTESALFELVSRAGGKLSERLGIGSVRPADGGGARAALPADPAAARLYAEGLERTRAADLLGARERLEQAARIEPAFPLVHTALAEVWDSLGYDQRARDEAALAVPLAVDLPREGRLLVEARQAEASRDWPRAIGSYGALFGFFPDDLEYGLRFARAQVNGSRAPDALRTIDTLRALPPPAGSDPRIDLLEALAAGSVSDYRRGLAAAGRSAARADEMGARLIAADARIQEGWASQRLGESERALRLFEEAGRTYAAVGQKTAVARTAFLRGRGLAAQGDRAEAQRLYEEALVTFQEAGDQRSIASVMNDLGNLDYDHGDLAGARRHYEQASMIYREAGNPSGLAGALGNIANILDNQGDLEGARKLHEEAIVLFREGSNQGGVARSIFNLGLVLAEEGRLDAAGQRFEEALAMHRESGYKRGIGYVTSSLGDLALARDDLPKARRSYEESLALREELGEKVNAAMNRMLLAQLAVEEGQPGDGARLAREAAGVFAAQEQRDLECAAQAVFCRALLAQDKSREALDTARRAVELAAKSQSRVTRIDAMTVLARAEAASGQTEAAFRKAEDALAEAERYGLVPQQFEARLVRAEIAQRGGPTAGTAAQLVALERDAQAAGFALVARKAAALGRAERRN